MEYIIKMRDECVNDKATNIILVLSLRLSLQPVRNVIWKMRVWFVY